MNKTAALARAIQAELPKDDGPVAFLGQAELLQAILADPSFEDDHHPQLLVDDRSKLAKLAKLAKLQEHTGSPNVVRAGPLHLPLPRRSLGALVAALCLGRLDVRDASIFAAWSDLLRPKGNLLLVERLHLSPTRRTLGRLLPFGSALAPEDLTCWLLNAGYTGIGQVFPDDGSGSLVVTRGHFNPLP